MAAALGLGLGLASGVLAQSGNPFATAVIVNESPISNYEIQQRALILRLFNTPGNLQEVAREQLIDERLQRFTARQFEIEPTEEEIMTGMEEFAGRANLSAEEFISRLAQAGVDAATFRDFVSAGVAWRQVVRGLFGAQAQSQITDSAIDRAVSTTSQRGSAEVFLAEIILPARTPPEAARAQARALQLSQTLTSEAAFAAAARQFSASTSRARGGRVTQPVPLSNLPAQLRAQLLGLRPGETSAPIPIPNAIALFQLRGLQETDRPEPEQVFIEYATYLIPGRPGADTSAVVARIDARTDQCGDLYGVNLGQQEERLTVQTQSVDEIPPDIALELAKLDPGEISATLTRGDAVLMLMLCKRTVLNPEEVDRGRVRAQLIERQLAGYASGLLSELRADAIITEP